MSEPDTETYAACKGGLSALGQIFTIDGGMTRKMIYAED